MTSFLRLRHNPTPSICQLIKRHRGVKEAIRAIKALIDRGADVNCRAESDTTAALSMSMDGHSGRRGSLSSSTAVGGGCTAGVHSVMIQDGHTPLMLAVLVDDAVPICRELLAQKADLTFVCREDGLSALTVAIINRKRDVVELVCEAAEEQGLIADVVNPQPTSEHVPLFALPLECAICLNDPITCLLYTSPSPRDRG